jgi:hypothetical protein
MISRAPPSYREIKPDFQRTDGTNAHVFIRTAANRIVHVCHLACHNLAFASPGPERPDLAFQWCGGIHGATVREGIRGGNTGKNSWWKPRGKNHGGNCQKSNAPEAFCWTTQAGLVMNSVTTLMTSRNTEGILLDHADRLEILALRQQLNHVIQHSSSPINFSPKPKM